MNYLADNKKELKRREERPSWDQYFMGLAFAAAQRSQDQSIKHGCVLVSKTTNIILATGYNNPIAGLSVDKINIIDRPEKYKWMRHAEWNAVLNSSLPLRFVAGGVKAYVTGLPCSDCIQLLAQSGVDEVYMARRRGFLSHSEEIQRDFNLIVEEKKITLVEVGLDEVQWLKNIEFD